MNTATQYKATNPTPCSEEEYWDLLEVLPPRRWCRLGVWEVFYMMEPITDTLYHWGAKHIPSNTHYQFIDSATISAHDLLNKLTPVTPSPKKESNNG
ncbi:hypothetical protein [Bowmanella sp. JS7-9]|uniref:Uncharacterized protein n=1 Tax=Pseudobowmanella zhangzhouensis TaxID=1537679 RepID=A0ABW1XME2_9ALTE|nr:hypothetical protein [Bowmanella sp. JS7-9]TBX21906.1 hypothetical protein TK45_10460 [Bowmanella sp. JS7-9]